MTTVEIIEGCKRGDSRAQQELYSTQYNKLRGTCIKHSPQDGEDMTQDAFMKAYTLFDKFEGDSEGQLFAWLKSLAINERFWEGQRTGRFKEDVTDFTELSFLHPSANDDEEEINDTTKEDSQTNDIMWAIDMLDDEKREVFNLIAIDGYTITKAAKKLNFRVSCVRYRYTKGQKKIKMFIRNKGLYSKLNKLSNNE